MSGKPATDRIAKIELDQGSLAALSADAEHERRVAIFDLLEENSFSVAGVDAGPYHVTLSTADNNLIFAVQTEAGADVKAIILSMNPLKKSIRDYFIMCTSYYDAIRTKAPQQIEAVDMGRRALHNEGSELLQERLAGKADMDFDTARRLFTLICALHRPR